MELAVTRSAVLVLVGAHSDHQRRSLGKAVVTEGLRWLKRVERPGHWQTDMIHRRRLVRVGARPKALNFSELAS
jgi:hypothetical protein